MDHNTPELNIADLSDADALEKIGLLIDDAWDKKSSQAIDRAFTLLRELEARNPSPEILALAHYFRANAWAGRESMHAKGNEWSWERPETQEQILELRRAIRHEGFQQLPTVRQCQILTNLANQLDTIGRFIDAVEVYDRVLALNKNFGMAVGNRGIALKHYARTLYDRGHAASMLIAAHEALISTEGKAYYEGPSSKAAQAVFIKEARDIESHMDIAGVRQKRAAKEHSMGRSASERRYRSWCLTNRLFVNPLNDLGTSSIAARDVMTLPSLTTDISSGGRVPPAIGFFNQMKQEFVSARYLYYEALQSDTPHFSDRDVLLYNTLDYPAYSLATEKTRAVFRLAYSLFDKIAFFLNDYLALGHAPDRVSFRSVWYEPKGSPPKPLLQRFTRLANWPLRGLFWLSKDLFEDEFQSVTEPDAAFLNKIRNYLEHKYLQLHLEMIPAAQQLGYSINKSDFEARTLRLLKLARGALIYLSLAVRSEERRRHNQSNLVMPMPLDVWDDDWKR